MRKRENTTISTTLTSNLGQFQVLPLDGSHSDVTTDEHINVISEEKLTKFHMLVFHK